MSDTSDSSSSESDVRHRRRRREANRIAAARYRQRRAASLHSIDLKLQTVHKTNKRLLKEVAKLRAEVTKLQSGTVKPD